MSEVLRILTEDIVNGSYLMIGNGNLVLWDSGLSSLQYGYEMFANCANLVTFEGNLNSLIGDWGRNLVITKHGYNNNTGEYFILHVKNDKGMFEGCSNLSSITTNFQNLTDGGTMFKDCTSLTEWNIPLPKLKYGYGMFQNTSISSFNVPLNNLLKAGIIYYDTEYYIEDESLETGNEILEWIEQRPTGMFKDCKYLTSWTIDLPNLQDGTNMFNGCSNLTTFSGNLDSLDRGGVYNDVYDVKQGMFQDAGITSWDVQLGNLSEGICMFNGCPLERFSVDTLPVLYTSDYMFANTKLRSVPNTYMPNISSARGMFADCLYLETLKIPENDGLLIDASCMFAYNGNVLGDMTLENLHIRQVFNFDFVDTIPECSNCMFAVVDGYYEFAPYWTFILNLPYIKLECSDLTELENKLNDKVDSSSEFLSCFVHGRKIEDGDYETLNILTTIGQHFPYQWDNCHLGVIQTSQNNINKLVLLGWEYVGDFEEMWESDELYEIDFPWNWDCWEYPAECYSIPNPWEDFEDRKTFIFVNVKN